MAKSIATASVISSLDGEADWDFEPELYDHPTISPELIPQTEEMAALQSRMLNMENALSRVIRYIEDKDRAYPEMDKHM